MMKFLLILLSFYIISCATSINRKLPDVGKMDLTTSKIIKLSFDESLQDYEVDSIIKALGNAGFSKNIIMGSKIPRKFKDHSDIKSFDDFFPAPDTQLPKLDLQVKITWKQYGFFEPYCAVFLTAIPCTPPYRWFIGARVLDENGKFIKDYALTESATGMFWLAFLNPIYWNTSPGVSDKLLSNAFKNLMLDLKTDGLI